MENPNLNLLASPNGLGRLSWKSIGLALLLLFGGLMLLYLLSVRANRKLKRRMVGLADEIDALQGLIDAGAADQNASQPINLPGIPDPKPVQAPPGFRMPILNPGLKFNIQPEFSLPFPAFHAWNTGETLRVLVVLDHAGTFGDFRQQAAAKPFPAWVFQLFSLGGAMLKESHLPIAEEQPDGKRIVAEIRALLESGLDEPPKY